VRRLDFSVPCRLGVGEEKEEKEKTSTKNEKIKMRTPCNYYFFNKTNQDNQEKRQRRGWL